MSATPRLLGLALALASALSVHAGPRDHVNDVADAIEQVYFDETVATRVAGELRDEAAAGRFDALVEPGELAAALSARLEPIDAHFDVGWQAPATSDADARPAPSPVPPTLGHGVQRVEWLSGGVALIDLRMLAAFQYGEPSEPAREAIEAALRLTEGARALIIDLRYTPGGSPAMVGYLTSAFTAPGSNIFNTFHGRGGRTLSEAPPEWHPSPRTQLPLYLLTSGRTGSAAEALAYTLKHAGRATLIGERTIGAANPGDRIPLDDGFSVFVSVATPINTVTGGNWEGDGVEPDVAVDAVAALQAAQRHALDAIVAAAPDATDAAWALAALRAADTPREFDGRELVGRYGELEVAADGDRLQLRQGRRPALQLLAIDRDLFAVAADPARRIAFTRNADGHVEALESRRVDGRLVRYRREG